MKTIINALTYVGEGRKFAAVKITAAGVLTLAEARDVLKKQMPNNTCQNVTLEYIGEAK